MAENTELREIPGRPGFYYVIEWVNGTAVDTGKTVDFVSYEQRIMDKLGIAQEDMKNIGRAIVDGHSEGALKGADSETNDYPKIMMGSTVTFTGNLTVDIERLHDSIRNKSTMVEIGIESVELRELLKRGKAAFELLKELVSDIDDPYMPECIFCGCPEGYLSGHYDDCVYDCAKKFVEES